MWGAHRGVSANRHVHVMAVGIGTCRDRHKHYTFSTVALNGLENNAAMRSKYLSQFSLAVCILRNMKHARLWPVKSQLPFVIHVELIAWSVMHDSSSNIRVI